MSIAVRVVREDGDEACNKSVMISFTDLGRGWQLERTDSNGVAYFDAADGEAKVIVDASDCGTFYLENGKEITVRI